MVMNSLYMSLELEFLSRKSFVKKTSYPSPFIIEDQFERNAF